jgi:glutamyl-Q tRNA(Asp) synthetase
VQSSPSEPQIVTRFAPSPTGYLHLGHAYSALLAYRSAIAVGGRFLLRIEDIDQGRQRAEFIEAIFEDLDWLGVRWETPVRHQSAHFDLYRTFLDKLEAVGLIYPCFCSRKEILAEIARAGRAPHGPEGPVYPGTCRNLDLEIRAERLAAGDAHALRLDMAAAQQSTDPLVWEDQLAGRQVATPQVFGDVVLARRDTPTSYHLAVAVDDDFQGINLVVRGTDLFTSTHIHRLLQSLLGLSQPNYHHHALLTDASGRRYAKRDRALTLRELRRAGKSPGDVFAMAGLTGEMPI